MMTNEQRQFAEDNINLVYKYFALKNVSDEDERAHLMEKYCDCILSYKSQLVILAHIYILYLTNIGYICIIIIIGSVGGHQSQLFPWKIKN